MRKTYLYKAKINKQTEANCNQWLGLCHNLYNQALEQRINAYKEKKESISAFKQMSQLPELRKSSTELKAVGSQVLQDVIQRLIEGNIKTVTIRRNSTNKWFVSFSCDNTPMKKVPESTTEIGIDVGIKHFLVDSHSNSVY